MTECFYCRQVFDGNSFWALEMMFGTRERFEYGECPNCKSCLLMTPLDSFDLASHYPPNYYSFVPPSEKGSAVTAFLKARRGQHLLGRPNVIGAVMQKFKPLWDYPEITKFGMNVSNTVLDVGSGSGRFLSYLNENGLQQVLQGCDPYVPQDIVTSTYRVRKCSIFDMEGIFDFIFFNHSFEHLGSPSQSLAAARKLQAPGGRCIIRIPTTSSLAFERYKENWVQLDPPRHISIPSREGMRTMAESAEYQLESMLDDSTAFQFWASEQYVRGIPLRAPNSYDENPRESIFSLAEIESFERQAQAANAIHKGDQTAFVLKAI